MRMRIFCEVIFSSRVNLVKQEGIINHSMGEQIPISTFNSFVFSVGTALLHKGWVRDSSRKASVVTGLHEQTYLAELGDQELASLQGIPQAA
ncbi:hypothetical protein PhaeoP23_03738 (plasmid) [Phaeobacter piscinae]|uniref:Uncharacterized protein n=1 Tax=Phaeobacter piscinae TaxID=1580596 RepID=A0ABM6PJ93_9RHOB|nr:hypothetical protein PhaeoP36_03738 [Phaeobacter piscinae]AUQ88336.1 hypothetical protein PhaeoP42_03739 [Phaeobacter piscinae]AUR26219.1 hypothetical protein PhaeoP23_03738 [Phaeobacter piscinae]